MLQTAPLGGPHAAQPGSCGRIFLYLIPLPVPNIKSWADFLEVDGHHVGALQQSCEARSLVDISTECNDCLADAIGAAAHTRTSQALLMLFAHSLVHCSPSDPVATWEAYHENFCDDRKKASPNSQVRADIALHALQEQLANAGHRLSDFGIPVPPDFNEADSPNKERHRELHFDPREGASKADHQRRHMYPGQRRVAEFVVNEMSAYIATRCVGPA